MAVEKREDLPEEILSVLSSMPTYKTTLSKVVEETP
jgi:hypothetical protein